MSVDIKQFFLELSGLGFEQENIKNTQAEMLQT